MPNARPHIRSDFFLPFFPPFFSPFLIYSQISQNSLMVCESDPKVKREKDERKREKTVPEAALVRVSQSLAIWQYQNLVLKYMLIESKIKLKLECKLLYFYNSLFIDKLTIFNCTMH